jgi:pyruvate kinase
MNFSHGSYEYHQSVIDNSREAERIWPGRPLAIALDTKGPEIRTGNTPGDADIPIEAGHEMNITTDDKYKTASTDKNMYAPILLTPSLTWQGTSTTRTSRG